MGEWVPKFQRCPQSHGGRCSQKLFPSMAGRFGKTVCAVAGAMPEMRTFLKPASKLEIFYKWNRNNNKTQSTDWDIPIGSSHSAWQERKAKADLESSQEAYLARLTKAQDKQMVSSKIRDRSEPKHVRLEESEAKRQRHKPRKMISWNPGDCFSDQEICAPFFSDRNSLKFQDSDLSDAAVGGAEKTGLRPASCGLGLRFSTFFHPLGRLGC